MIKHIVLLDLPADYDQTLCKDGAAGITVVDMDLAAVKAV
jgi:hypothetical protein